MSLKGGLRAMVLSDHSICEILCSRPEATEDPLSVKQRRGRLGYAFGIILLGIFTFFAKIFGDKMFFFVYDRNNCDKNTLLHSCFTLVMLYRIGFTLCFYHLVILILVSIKSSQLNYFNNFCWTLKIIIFLEIFFISCLITNDFFSFLAVLAQWFAVLLIVFVTIFLNDALFYYFNRHRKLKKTRFSIIWKAFAYFVGIIAFAAGFGLFVFCFIRYTHTCAPYVIILSINFGFSMVYLFINIARYKAKVEVAHALVFFFCLSMFNYNTLAATPFTTCAKVQAFSQNYWKVSSYLDAGFSNLTRYALCCNYPNIFGLC